MATYLKDSARQVVPPRPGDDPPAPNTYYYLRITEAEGEMAWASPVWVDPA